MKYAHINENNQILGWYSDDIHKDIPTPNIQVSDEVWQNALNIGANCIENNIGIVKDFRTPDELAEYNATKYKILRQAEYPPIEDYIDGIVKGNAVQVQDYIDKCLAVKAKYPKE